MYRDEKSIGSSRKVQNNLGWYVHTYLSRHPYTSLLSGPNHVSIETSESFANDLAWLQCLVLNAYMKILRFHLF